MGRGEQGHAGTRYQVKQGETEAGESRWQGRRNHGSRESSSNKQGKETSRVLTVQGRTGVGDISRGSRGAGGEYGRG